MLALNTRPCDIADDYSGKAVDRDGVKIRTLTFTLENIELEEREVNALLGDPGAYRSLFKSVDGVLTPFLRCCKAIEFEKAIDHACVVLTYGGGSEMSFSDCKIAKLKLALFEGGQVFMSCKITTAPTLDDTLAELFQQFGTRIACEIRAEVPTAQQDLPLNTHGVGEAPMGRKKPIRRANAARCSSPCPCPSNSRRRRFDSPFAPRASS